MSLIASSPDHSQPNGDGDEATDASRISLPGILENIARFLPPNDIVCNVRLVSKSLAAAFRDFTTVRLSQPVPEHAFRWRWGSPDSVLSMTLRQRRELLLLTAVSGCLSNLQIAAESAGLVLQATPRQTKATGGVGGGTSGVAIGATNGSIKGNSLVLTVLEAAAAAGRLEMCRCLRQIGCPWAGSLAAAAGAGQRVVVEWLLDNGCPWDRAAVYAAARGGHVGLMEDLLHWRPGTADDVRASGLLAAVAEGCDLATMRRMYDELLGPRDRCSTDDVAPQPRVSQPQDLSRLSRPLPQQELTQAQVQPLPAVSSVAVADQLLAAAEEAEVAVGEQEEGRGKQDPRQRQTSDAEPGPPPLLPRQQQQLHQEPVLQTLSPPSPPSPPPQQQTAPRQQQQLLAVDKASILVAAAASPTTDWREKVAWLEEAHGYQRAAAATVKAAARPDALNRVAWLRCRGYQLSATVANTAAAAGNLQLLEYLLSEGLRPSCEAAEVAAAGGHLAFLEALQAHRCPIRWYAIHGAAEGGHLAVVEWLLSNNNKRVSDNAILGAARSGSVALLAWLFEHRGRWWSYSEASIYKYAVEGGCEEALRWLAEHGYKMEDTGEPYYVAAVNGDLAVLRCLRRLGCPWGPDGEVFGVCVADGDCPAGALRWLLLEGGCPVTWPEALEAAGRRTGPDRGEVLDWLRGEAAKAVEANVAARATA